MSLQLSSKKLQKHAPYRTNTTTRPKAQSTSKMHCQDTKQTVLTQVLITCWHRCCRLPASSEHL